MRLPLLLSAAFLAMPALAGPPQVVTDIPPVQSLAAQVMDGVAEPVLLLDRGADPHHFQLRPSQARALANADLVFRVAPSLTPWLDPALAGAGAARVIGLLDGATPTRRRYDNGATDPHAWLDPDNAAAWLSRMARALAAADPANAAEYRANAAAAEDRLAALEARLADTLAPVAEVPLLFSHDAYGYFTSRFGLTAAGAIAAGDAADPGARRLSRLRDLAATAGPACIFPQAAHDPAYLHTVADGTGLRIGGALDPSGVTLAPGPGLYAALLEDLARTIADCAPG